MPFSMSLPLNSLLTALRTSNKCESDVLRFGKKNNVEDGGHAGTHYFENALNHEGISQVANIHNL